MEKKYMLKEIDSMEIMIQEKNFSCVDQGKNFSTNLKFINK